MKIQEKFPKKLLVEGNDDQHVIWALCQKYDVIESFDVVDCNGIDDLIEQIPIRFKSSETKTVGIIVDADDALQQRWEKIRNILTGTHFEVPADLPADGLIVSHEIQKAGVWIMPNNRVDGMLEDFISFLVPKDDPLTPIVESTLSEIESKELNRYAVRHHSKANIHTWLAWQEDPGTPLGLSITKSYLNADEETCVKLINWLNRLYG